MPEYKRRERLMGNQFEFTIVVDAPNRAPALLDLAVQEIARIEALLTTYAPTSQTNLINQQAGLQPVAVDAELFQLIQRANAISRITNGAFDLSYGSIDKRLWNFDTQMDALPDLATAKKMVRLIDYRNIVLDEANQTVFLKHKGMRIGFGGIGKGYAAACAKNVLIKAGVQNGIVNASGDLCTWGYQENGQAWTIGIAHPDDRNKAFSGMHISGLAVATSGNYEKFAMIAGKKYSHTIDPKTGLPIQGTKSVTVIANNAELADALTTPIAVMGIKAGLALVEQLPNVACIIIDDFNQMYTSSNIKCA